MGKRVSLKGRGAEIFFGGYTPDPPSPPTVSEPIPSTDPPRPAQEVTAPVAAPTDDHNPLPIVPPTAPAPAKPRNRAAVPPRHHDTTTPPLQDAIFESIRQAVKPIGKEAATYRFTPQEKRELTNIVFTYRTNDVRTSENEVTRIAVNFLIQDYHEHGEASILARVLALLNA